MLQVDVQGSGPALVLLHGWGLHGEVFAPLLPALCQRHTVYRVDLPGHGRSAGHPIPATLAGWACAVVDAVPPAHWLGWSLGGLVALQAALDPPGRIASLTMVAASPCFARRADWPHGIAPTLLDGFSSHLQHHYDDTVDRFLALDLLNLDGGQLAAGRLRDTLLAVGHPDPQAVQLAGQLLLHSDLRARLPALAMPSLWLGGGRDRLVAPGSITTAAGMTAGAEQRLYPRSGHAPFLGDTAAVADDLSAFLDSIN